MAIHLSEYSADKNIDVLRVVKRVLIHDLVEIDTGDTFCYYESDCIQIKNLFNK